MPGLQFMGMLCQLGWCKTWSLDCGLDYGLDCGLDCGLDYGLNIADLCTYTVAIAQVVDH